MVDFIYEVPVEFNEFVETIFRRASILLIEVNPSRLQNVNSLYFVRTDDM